MTQTTFTRNHSDRSNDKGYQFEFFCDKCGTGLRTAFQANKLGIAAGLLRAASSIFGSGRLGGLAQGTDYVRDALRGEGWDGAFKDAVEEARPRFRQCTRCGKWVCPEACWNASRNLCKACAPDLVEEGAALQASLDAQHQERSLRALQAEAGAAKAPAAPACPHCQAAVGAAARFCPECGKSLAAPAVCRKCGAALNAAGKFCADCGEPRA